VGSAAWAQVRVKAATREAAQSLRAPVMNNPSMFLCSRVHAILTFCQTISACQRAFVSNYDFFATFAGREQPLRHRRKLIQNKNGFIWSYY
jgi:hypothetical protein